jgi:hypothetical protein
MFRRILAIAVFAMVLPAQAAELPAGTYEPYFTGWDGSLTYWLAGDIRIQAGNRYVFQDETGGFAVNGTRITFDGGPLDGAYAEVRESSGEPAIVIPRKQNEELGKDFAVSDIWAYRKK